MKIKYNKVLIKIQVRGTFNLFMFHSFYVAIKYAPELIEESTEGVENPDMIVTIKYFHKERTEFDIYTAGETFRETYIEHLYLISKNEVMGMLTEEYENSVEVERKEEEDEEDEEDEEE